MATTKCFFYLRSPFSFPYETQICIARVAVIGRFLLPVKKTDAASETPVAEEQSVVNELPSLNVHEITGSTYSLRDLKGELALVFFSPSCEHCQHEAEFIRAQKALFANKHFYFITAESPEAASDFRTKYELTDANFHFSTANPAEVFNSVGNFKAMPTFFLYRNQKKIGKLEGTTPAETSPMYLV